VKETSLRTPLFYFSGGFYVHNFKQQFVFLDIYCALFYFCLTLIFFVNLLHLLQINYFYGVVCVCDVCKEKENSSDVKMTHIQRS
jgi:hypothetical protein